ncbi:MAG: hypothetical protein ACFFBD_22595 [Candidatus Hodarchaeota archaeon]
MRLISICLFLTIILSVCTISTNTLGPVTEFRFFSVPGSSEEVLYVPYHLVWGNASDEKCFGIAADDIGDIYLVGYSSSNHYSTDLLIMKWSSKGYPLWYKTWGGSFSNQGIDIDIDPRGNIYTVGSTGTTALKSDLLLVKWNREGNQLWNQTWGTTYQEEGEGIALGKDGIYTFGYTDTLTHGEDIVLIKWDAKGNRLWNRTWSTPSSDRCSGIAIDSYDNIYTFGFSGYNFLLIKWASTGDQLWNSTWGTRYDDYGLGITIDYAGNIYTVGLTYREDDWYYDHKLVSWTPNGDQLWSKTYTFYDSFNSKITVDESGNIYTCVSLYGTILLLKWNSVGNLLSESSYEAWGLGEIYGMVENYGNVYITAESYYGDSDVSFVIFSPDHDRDDLGSWLENIWGTDPVNPDTDGDTMPDGWEVEMDLNPLEPLDGNQDIDGDWIPNYAEYQAGTNPRNALSYPLFSLSFMNFIMGLGLIVVIVGFLLYKRRQKPIYFV